MTHSPNKARAYQAIVTRYHGPANVRGSRVKATASAGSVTLTWDDALNADENHMRAARALANKYGWHGEYHFGGMPDGSRVFVSADTQNGPAFVSEVKQ